MPEAVKHLGIPGRSLEYCGKFWEGLSEVGICEATDTDRTCVAWRVQGSDICTVLTLVPGLEEWSPQTEDLG